MFKAFGVKLARFFMFKAFGVKLARFFTKSEDSPMIAPEIVPAAVKFAGWGKKVRRGTVGVAGAFGRHLKKHAIPGGVTFSKPPKGAVA